MFEARASRRGLEELIQHDGCDQSSGANKAQQLQQSERFAGYGGELLRSHGVFLKIGKSEMVHGSEAGASRLAQTSMCSMPLSPLDRLEFPTGWRWIDSPPGGKPAFEKLTSLASSDTALTIAATAAPPKTEYQVLDKGLPCRESQKRITAAPPVPAPTT